MKSISNSEKILFNSIILEIVSLLVLVLLSAYLLFMQHKGQDDLKNAGILRYESYLLADQLRQSSDDLTRMVRSYAASGDDTFVDYFWQILDIRNGNASRPEYYERIFWDFMTVDNPNPPYGNGKAVSLEVLMRNIGITDNEFILLAKAQEHSDQLVGLENKAIHAMKGMFLDGDGVFTITGEPNRDFALDILFGEEYHDAKKSIMAPINLFLAAIDNRTSSNVLDAESQMSLYSNRLTLVWAGLICNVALLILTTIRYHYVSSRILMLTNEELDEKREHLAVTLRSIADGVITTDALGNIVFVNNVTEIMTGWSQEAAVGKSFHEVFNTVHELSGIPCRNMVESILASEQVAEMEEHTVLIAINGARHVIENSGAPIFDGNGKIIGTVLVYRDVTDEKILARELAKAKKLESVGVLAGGIAHDFNNILTAILGNIELAELHIAPASEANLLLAEARQASIRARDLTQQLLTFAKGGDPVKHTSSIGQIISESADFVLRGSSVMCNYNIPEELWMCDVDTGQISQVIQNIVINARDAMIKGGVIEVSCRNVTDVISYNMNMVEGMYVEILIADSGSGIPVDVIESIFDPFFTTKNEGSGLGLSISHSIIKRHKGSISAQSAPSKGTIITILLPATEAIVVQDTTMKEQGYAEVGDASILIMDDELMIRKVTKHMLERSGHDVLLAENGEEAIRIYRDYHESKHCIDVVVMDLTIPGGMGGREAVQEILKINPEAKVIVASGYSTDPVMANYREYGFVASIVKPFRLTEINSLINEVITEKVC